LENPSVDSSYDGAFLFLVLNRNDFQATNLAARYPVKPTAPSALLLGTSAKGRNEATRCLLAEAGSALVEDGLLDTLALGEGDEGVLDVCTLANDEGVRETSGEDGAVGVLDLDNIEGARVALTVEENADTASVTTLGDHDGVASLELDVVDDLASGEVNLDGVVDLDQGVRVAESAAVVGDDERDALAGGALLVLQVSRNGLEIES
jgi:hypothetical protein